MGFTTEFKIAWTWCQRRRCKRPHPGIFHDEGCWIGFLVLLFYCLMKIWMPRYLCKLWVNMAKRNLAQGTITDIWRGILYAPTGAGGCSSCTIAELCFSDTASRMKQVHNAMIWSFRGAISCWLKKMQYRYSCAWRPVFKDNDVLFDGNQRTH